MKLVQNRKHGKFWTPEEDALLLENKHLTEKQVAELFAERFPHRTLSSIMNRKSLIGAGRYSGIKKRAWTEEDYAFMRANTHMTDAEMAAALGAGLTSLSSARKKADIRKVYHCVKCGVQLTQQGAYCKDHQFYTRRWAAYRDKSKNRGLEFDLPLQTFHALIESPCHYCGDEGGGIDRIDSSKGYTPNNTVSCCWVCNAMKNNHTTEVWLSHMQKIINRFGVSQ